MLLALASVSPVTAADARLRVIVETDAGGDPDDEQSLVRFLLYTNEWDVEGIVANRPVARDGENRNAERTGLGIVQRMIRAYGECHARLVEHDPRYPSAEALLERCVASYDDVEDGVELVLHAVDSEDPRPVWFLNWGTDRGSSRSCLARALDRVLAERGEDGYARFKSRLRLSSYDAFGEHTMRAPPFAIWVDTFRPEKDGKRWYHRFSEITRTAGEFDIERDCRTGHGPLGALYPTNTTHRQKEGDTPTFLYLVPNGLGDPREPTWGSWAGRYSLRTDVDARPYYWADAADTWNGGTHRDRSLERFAADLQNDFRARLDWCISPHDAANHPPVVVVAGVTGSGCLRLAPRVGTTVTLDATETSDPDGDALSWSWIVYEEAGTHPRSVPIDGASAPKATLSIPRDAADSTLHVLLSVTDAGSPPLTRYRRIVLSPIDPDASWNRVATAFVPPEEPTAPKNAYRSPLLRDDGSRVASPEEWQERRREILGAWHVAMGPWPNVIERPRLETIDSKQRDGFAQRRVRFEYAPGLTTEGWLLVPSGDGPFPAVLVVYYEPETSVGLHPTSEHRDFGLELARRGFVTLSIGTPAGDAWLPGTAATGIQPLSFYAWVAANAWQALASLDEVDDTRIGVVGHSYGGKWAMFAAALWDGFACCAVSDPGIVFDESRPNVNYWEPWYLGREDGVPPTRRGPPSDAMPRTGAYRRLVEAGRDLHELHALIAPRPFFVSGGSEDTPERWAALRHAAGVNRLLGHDDRVGMTNRPGHSPTPESNAQLYAFFEHFLLRGR